MEPPFDEGKIKIYRFTRVLFGLTSSPFLLAATIKFHLKNYEKTYPQTIKIIRESLYVDDVIGCEDNVDKAFSFSQEAIKIFEDAGMQLRKWNSNSKPLIDLWETNNIQIDHTIENSDLIPSEHKVLGIGCNSDTDIFYFDTKHLIKFLSEGRHTKRFLLKAADRIFDPIGYLSPFVVIIKCLIQAVWCAGIDWDEELPQEIARDFQDWCNGVKKLKDIEIPRYYLRDTLGDSIQDIQLHIFSDASLKAYGCVAYLRIVTKSDKIYTSFVASKSRVSPLKSLSLPRLELMAALLAA
nr:uncharacterized protein LOC122272512 [Parasteatoda tepidariorum]